MKKNYLYIAVALLLSACNENSTLDMAGMFSPNGEVVNTRFEQSMAYNQTRGEISLNMGADDYVIYVCTDSHITRTTHKNLDYFVSQYRAETAPKMAIHLGDVIDAQKNFPCADSILHFSGQTIADICLDSAEGTLGTKQMKWLKELLESKSKEPYRRIIVYTHTHIWKLDGSQGHTSNMALEETYELTSLLADYKIPYVWCGHQHARQSVFFKGVNYLVLNATKDSEKGQSYLKVDMGDAAIYHYIDFPPIDNL